MTVQQLEYVVALDETRHFVRAAQKCFVTQPTLTMQLKKLEEEIGFQIFDRGKHPIEPTRPGGTFILKARQIIRDMQQLRDLVNEEHTSLRGQHRIGIIPTLSPYLAPKALGSFIDDNPEADLLVEELQTEMIIEKLKRDQLDMGILATPLDDPDIREVPLFYEPFWVYTSPQHKLAECREVLPRDITTSGLWLLDEGHCFREQVLNICSKRSTKSERMHYQSGSIETLKNLVAYQGGYTLVPDLSIVDMDKAFLRPFTEPKPVREISIVVHRNYPREALIEGIRNAVLAVIPESLRKNEQHFRVKWR